MQIVEEAGGKVTRMDGGEFSVFDRSVMVSNGVLHEKASLKTSTCIASFTNVLIGRKYSSFFPPCNAAPLVSN